MALSSRLNRIHVILASTFSTETVLQGICLPAMKMCPSRKTPIFPGCFNQSASFRDAFQTAMRKRISLRPLPTERVWRVLFNRGRLKWLFTALRPRLIIMPYIFYLYIFIFGDTNLMLSRTHYAPNNYTEIPFCFESFCLE